MSRPPRRVLQISAAMQSAPVPRANIIRTWLSAYTASWRASQESQRRLSGALPRDKCGAVRCSERKWYDVERLHHSGTYAADAAEYCLRVDNRGIPKCVGLSQH